MVSGGSSRLSRSDCPSTHPQSIASVAQQPGIHMQQRHATCAGGPSPDASTNCQSEPLLFWPPRPPGAAGQVAADLGRPGYMDDIRKATNDIDVQIVFCNAGYILSGFFYSKWVTAGTSLLPPCASRVVWTVALQHMQPRRGMCGLCYG